MKNITTILKECRSYKSSNLSFLCLFESGFFSDNREIKEVSSFYIYLTIIYEALQSIHNTTKHLLSIFCQALY